MSGINDTAYPRLKTEISDEDLISVFTPTDAERGFIADAYSRATVQALMAIQLKTLQRLGNFVAVASVPNAIIKHICGRYKVRPFDAETLHRYDLSGSKPSHQRRLREFVGLRLLDAAAPGWLEGEAIKAAQTKQELPDIINVLLEELVHHRYELPGFVTRSRLASRARVKVNDEICRRISTALTTAQQTQIDQMFRTQKGRSQWDQLKREPKQPSVREVASFLTHIQALRVLAAGLPVITDVSVSKRTQFVLEARALNVREMQALKPIKRYALAVLLIQAQLQKAVDDIADIFIRSVRNMHNVARERLKQYQLEHVAQGEALIAQFREVLTAFEDDGTDPQRVGRMRKLLDDDPAAWIERCDEHMAYAGNNYYPFMQQPYRAKRSLLFQCLDAMSLKSSSPDDALLRAIDWIAQFRSSHKEYVPADSGALPLELAWLTDRKWHALIRGHGEDAESGLVHRKYLELCILTHVMDELKSGDLYVQNSDQYDDYRDHLVDWEAFDAEIGEYSEMVGLPADADDFVTQHKQQLANLAREVDARFPDNEHVAMTESGLLLRRSERAPPPEGLPEVDQAITASMATASILDVLTETERWLDLHKLFGPLSGFESKVDDPRKRFLTTLFCYGCNLGPTQTALSVKGLSRKQVAWLNLHHVTEERLDKAIFKVVNAYSRFSLPQYWGTGKSASADGTKWNVYEQNLLSEYHLRYGGYGGIGYYHVSDMYIALFSHFIPCGVYEAVYILDGLVKNESDIQPDTLHGDTQAQSAPVFGLSHLLGIKLMPRMRNIKELVFFKAEPGAQYKHIQSLFRGSIDWDLIKLHYRDMLRVAVSIKLGKITPSMILRRLGTFSHKNKLYFAFRELGRVIRTLFLLDYISDIELRQSIHAATNKSEEFNNFVKWLFFGGEGVIAENIRHEQRKVIKYSQLVANMVILHNVQWMSRKLKELQGQGYPVGEPVLKALSPYRTSHINRFGDYTLDLSRAVEPIDYKIKFA
ncbi:Tn3 family transposase [Verminephrobacter aporrectodeae]|uniref:Tn3 family transposase n=1 Tax=Verminephrobacter aporrectodeae TaxID=1110389 RepID=UPI0022445F9C|nr:Tn3 family transposase [Verminephrobacter aporrectodeae]MCW8175297.1 Tn3 family transposase [Verminephrobacter aporrectodeae subsp. tuberculatae]MCW8202782.1 Tn3 family transposase [Verminephrobacter aporrectodeae subsp. tuberculatae]